MSKKQQLAPYLPGAEPATPSPRPLSTEDGAEAKQRAVDLGPCVVCGYAIGAKQSFVAVIPHGHRHADCMMAGEFSSPLAAAVAATFERETDGGEPGSFPLPSEPATPKKRKERTPRTPARAAVYIERMLAKYTLQQRRGIMAMLSSCCEPQLGDQP